VSQIDFYAGTHGLDVIWIVAGEALGPALMATGIADVGGCDVVKFVGLKKGEYGEALHELVPVPGAGKTLQHFLEHQSRGEHLLGAQESAAECTHLRHTRLAITAESQRPDRRIDQQTHRWRSRSAL
jgi:hypothetical protein